MIVIWIGFVLAILFFLALDLGVFNREAEVMRIRVALAWTGVWITLAMAFNVAVYFMYEHHWLGIGEHAGGDLSGKQAALQYFTGYVVEKSLSLDNVFVIALIFSYFKVPQRYQHRVLFWGVLGALVLRGAMIGAGALAIQRFDWIVYVFGALLLYSAARMLRAGHDDIEPDKNPVVRLVRRLYPVSRDFDGHHFTTHADGRRALTPLFVCLIVVETSDVLFAVDSIPAIFGVTRDPFLVFTSNVFAILGLRTLYFALAGLMDRFRYLKLSLVLVLAFVGVKMIISHHLHIPTWISLCVIVGVLGGGVIASLFGSPHAHGSSADAAG